MIAAPSAADVAVRHLLDGWARLPHAARAGRDAVVIAAPSAADVAVRHLLDRRRGFRTQLALGGMPS